MRGSGSEKPCSCAILTALLNGISAEIVLKMKFRVPLSTASSFSIRSPLLQRSFIVLIIGSPAPTLVSNRNFTPWRSAVSFSLR